MNVIFSSARLCNSSPPTDPECLLLRRSLPVLVQLDLDGRPRGVGVLLGRDPRGQEVDEGGLAHAGVAQDQDANAVERGHRAGKRSLRNNVELSGLKTKERPCRRYSNLTNLIQIICECNIVDPFFTVPITFWVLPWL